MKEKIEIEIPVEISTKKLTLEQIGAITVMMTLPHVDDASKMYYSDELDEIADGLVSLGILNMKDGTVEIDLSDKEPESYFEVEDWDDNDNPIYAAPSYFTNEGSPYYWRVKPILWDMKILWKNCSDEDIRTKFDEDVFDSLEDAEAYFREEDKKSLNYYGSK
jgi:hypothetical protein